MTSWLAAVWVAGSLDLAAAADREISSVWAHGYQLCSRSLLGINVFWYLLQPVLLLGPAVLSL